MNGPGSAAVSPSQRSAAKVVGLSYLLVLIPAIFAEFYVSGRLIDYDNAAVTAANIMANERLFRLGIACNLSVFAIDVVLITALYVVLRPINRRLALLALGWRMIETVVLVMTTLSDLDVLRVLGRAAYLRAFEAEQLFALARFSIGAHNAAYNLGLAFAGFGSTLFCYLWLQSRFVPRAIALLGVFSSLLMGFCTFAFIVFPELAKVVTVAYYAGPIFIFEVVIGLWLTFRRLPDGAPAAVDGAAGAESP